MRLETSQNSVRIPFCQGDSFVDIEWIEKYEHNALMVRSITPFCFWAVIKLQEVGQYDPFRIVLFPNRGWFNEWYESLAVKPEILFSQGKQSH